MTQDWRNDGGIDWGAADDDQFLRADELSPRLLAQFGPTLERALRRFSQSMTPEGKRRLSAAFRQRALMNARDTAGEQSSFLTGKGFSPAYSAGLGLNAYSRAQRDSTAFDVAQNDPNKDIATSLGVLSGIAPYSGPSPAPGKGMFGDILNIAGQFLGGGSMPSAAKPQRTVPTSQGDGVFFGDQYGAF